MGEIVQYLTIPIFLITIFTTAYGQTEENSIDTSLFFIKTDTADIDPICILPVFKEPEFPGGQDSLNAFVKRNLKWPAPDWCGQGTVFVQFTVDTLGKVKHVQILRGVNDLADKEVLRIISLMPDWNPAIDDKGKKTTAKLVLPFVFKMQ